MTQSAISPQTRRRRALGTLGASLLAFVVVALVLPLLGDLFADSTLSAVEMLRQSLSASPSALGQPLPDISFDYPHHFFLGALTGILPLCNVGAYWLALLGLRRGARLRNIWLATLGVTALFCTATFWLLGEEVALTAQWFGRGYRSISWTDISWMAGAIRQEPAIIPVGALLVLAVSAGTVGCAAFASSRLRALSRRLSSPRDTAPQTLVLEMALVFAVTTLLVIAQDLLGSQINFTAIQFDPQTGQSTLGGMLISAALFLALPAALMIGATWHAWRQRPQPEHEREHEREAQADDEWAGQATGE